MVVPYVEIRLGVFDQPSLLLLLFYHLPSLELLFSCSLRLPFFYQLLRIHFLFVRFNHVDRRFEDNFNLHNITTGLLINSSIFGDIRIHYVASESSGRRPQPRCLH